MARAKRTDRAEARRRYRAYLAEVSAQETDDEDLADEPQPKKAARPERETSPVRPGQRLGFFAAMRAAVRPVHYGEDLRFLPQLVVATPAVWLPSLIAVLSAGIAIARLSGATLQQARDDWMIQVTVGFVLNPFMPMLPALIAGFFAPRATWLAGILVSFVTTIAYLVVLEVGGSVLAQVGGEALPSGPFVAGLQLMLYSLPFGAALAAFSGWYKRFLNLTGPAAAMGQQRSRGKPRRGSPARKPAR